METGFPERCLPRFRLLDKAQILKLHESALRILEEVGVRVLDPEGMTLLRDNGAKIIGNKTLSLPAYMVEEAIASAPKNLVIYNRNKSPVMELGGRRIHFGTGTDLPKTIDLETRTIRDTREADITAAAVISDALPHIDFIGSYGLPRDVAPGLHYIRCFHLETLHTQKPVFFTAESTKDLEVIHEMAATVAGGKDVLPRYPFLIHYSEPVSPLTHSGEAVKKLLFCAKNRIPVTYTPALLAGSSGPVTLAGAVAVAVAEALSGLTLHQLAGKGAPIISGIAATIMDMKRGTVSYTAPEFRLTHSACAELFHHYGLPVWGTAGCSDAQFPDLQAGAEYAFTLFNASMDGANLIHDCGYMGQGFTGSPEMIVFADEMIGFVKRYMEGFCIDDAHLALDVVRSVGPGGHFLGEKHTLDHFQHEQWQPNLFNRQNLANWMQQGEKRIEARLIEKAKHLRAHHVPEPVAEDVREELDRIWKNAQER